MTETFLISYNRSPMAAPVEIDVADAAGTAVFGLIKDGGLPTYEPETTSCILAAIDYFGLSRFADIGANFGLYSLLAKATFGDALKVVAFEPLPRLRDIAEKVANKNRLSYTLLPQALSNADGTATFYVSARSDASN